MPEVPYIILSKGQRPPSLPECSLCQLPTEAYSRTQYMKGEHWFDHYRFHDIAHPLCDIVTALREEVDALKARLNDHEETVINGE